MNKADVREMITRVHREEWARVVASLTRRFGDLDIAEEAAAEAFAAAVERWAADGVPPNAGAWRLSTVSSTGWPAITPTMRPAPTYCADWAAVRSRAQRTTKP